MVFKNSPAGSRDPVAQAIEIFLIKMQAKGAGSLYREITAQGVELAFDGFRAEGKTLDIALVRLAGEMMGNEKYALPLIETLKPMKSAPA